MIDDLNDADAGALCSIAVQCLHELDGSMTSFPGLLKKIIRNRAWERRVDHGHVIELSSLRELITLKPLKGWNETIEAVKRAVRDDPEALSMLDAELKGKHGGDRKSEQAEIKIDNVQLDSPTGNAQTAGLRRLRKDRPDLHADVVAGKMSTHAAMVKAGFRRKTITVPVDDCGKAVEILLKHFTAEQIVAEITLR